MFVIKPLGVEMSFLWMQNTVLTLFMDDYFLSLKAWAVRRVCVTGVDPIKG